MEIDVQQIRIDGGTQPRSEINEQVVSEYAYDLAEGAKFPPVVCFFDGVEYWLADGFHRYHAAQSANLETIECDIRKGTKRDAVLYSVGANAAHGLRRTNQDKRQAVETLLQDEEWSKWSDREIARQCAVHKKTVGRLRDELSLALSASEDKKPLQRTYTTKHGTETTMKISGGQKPVEPDLYQQTEKDSGYSDQSLEYFSQQIEEQKQETDEHKAESLQNQTPETQVKTEVSHSNFRAITTGENEWYTPDWIVELVRNTMGKIDLDPASCKEANEVIQASNYFDESINALEKEWRGKVWLNPPYSRDLMPKFVDKLIQEYEAGNTKEALLVSHNVTETNWFQKLAKKSRGICFPDTRIKFYRGEEVAAPVNGQCFFYLGVNYDNFKSNFGEHGIIVKVDDGSLF